jgi:hypothetical protein
MLSFNMLQAHLKSPNATLVAARHKKNIIYSWLLIIDATLKYAKD